MKLKAIFCCLILIFFASCTTVSERSSNAKLNSSSFWFALDPLILTKDKNYCVKTFYSGKKEFDELYLKSSILIKSIEDKTAFELYKINQIIYELQMTIAMIDSKDPIKTFSGPSIKMAQNAYETLIEQRRTLANYIELLK